MVAVAVAALVFAMIPLLGSALSGLSVFNRQLAAQHARLGSETRVRGQALSAHGSISVEFPTPLSEYHDLLRKKYEQAATNPLMMLLPDPPSPGARWVIHRWHLQASAGLCVDR
jgi:hypothetical protein